MPTERRAGHDIYHRTLGQGPRQALLLHCSLAHGGAWRGLAGFLEDDFTFTAFDHLDHGRSDAWNREGDYHGVSTEVGKSFLQQEPIDLVGHSFGATVALRMAVECPEKVRSLVLIEPVFFAVAIRDDPARADEHRQEMEDMRALLDAGEREAAAKAFLAEWGGGGLPWEQLPQEARADMAAKIHIILDAEPQLYGDKAGLLDAGRLEGLTMPVLLVRGADSPGSIAAINAGLARRIPGAQSVSVAGAGHMAPITHPKACADELRRFWGLQGPGSEP